MTDSADSDVPTIRLVGGHSEQDSKRIEAHGIAVMRVDSADFQSVSGVVLRETIRLWWDLLTRATLVPVPPNVTAATFPKDARSYLANAHPAQLDHVVDLLGTVELADEEAMRTAALTALEHFNQVLMEIRHRDSQGNDAVMYGEDGLPHDPSVERSMWLARSRMLQETAKTIPLIDEVRERAVAGVASVKEAQVEMDMTVERLDELKTELAAARAEKAQNELATHFGNLSDSERSTSNIFRLATGGLIVAAAVIGGFVAGADGWESVAAHIAVAVSAAGGSAYTARLGSLHRATADWAQSIKVQLDTLKDFLAEIEDDDTRKRVYEEFGRRVLGSPPSPSGDEPTPLPTAQIIDLASALAKARS